MSRKATILFTLALVAPCALAGNPIMLVETGPLRWDTSSSVTWNPDGGSLGKWVNATANSEVDAGFDRWEAVPTSNITFTQGGQITYPPSGLPIDVTSATFSAVINSTNSENPIIYDNNLDIIGAVGLPPTIIGIAGPLITNGSTLEKAWVMINGDWFDGDLFDVGEKPADLMRHTITHEIGHLLGLGHSSANHELTVGVAGCPLPTLTQIETMKPFSSGPETPAIHHDDAMMLSHLYPGATFNSANARIRGRVLWTDGVVLMDGANMVIRPDTAVCADLYGFAQGQQAGVSPLEFGGDGAYEFAGLTPGADYTLQQVTIADGGAYPLDACCFLDEYYNASEDYFNPPDNPNDVDAVSAGAAGTTTSGFDVLLNNDDGPGSVASVGASRLNATHLDGNTVIDETFATDIEFGVRRHRVPAGDQIAWLSRYQPQPGQLPLEINGFQAVFGRLEPITGRAIRLLVYTDPSGSGDIANATLVYSEDTVIPPADPSGYDFFSLSSPVAVTSGDLYVGFYDLVSDSVGFFGLCDPFVDGDGLIATNSTDPGDFSEFLSGNFYLRALVSITPPVDSVLLEWGDPCNVATNAFQDFAVYEGGIASLGGTMDHLAITCSTGLAKRWIVPSGGGDRFWLTTPVVANREGDLGAGTGGSNRLPTVSCQTIQPASCP